DCGVRRDRGNRRHVGVGVQNRAVRPSRRDREGKQYDEENNQRRRQDPPPGVAAGPAVLALVATQSLQSRIALGAGLLDLRSSGLAVLRVGLGHYAASAFCFITSYSSDVMAPLSSSSFALLICVAALLSVGYAAANCLAWARYASVRRSAIDLLSVTR